MTTDVMAVTAVMARDAARLETGIALLGAQLAGADGPTGAVMLDVDGSAAIREKGMSAKRALVRELQALVRATVPAGCGTVIDSGTRDEILILMPGETATGCTDRAAALLDAIRAYPFRSDFWDGDQHVTASLGAVVLDPALPPDVAFATARAALAVAKLDRDCVRFTADDIRPIAVPADRADATDVELAEVVTRGVRRAEEKYGPMWYWLGRADEMPTDALRAAATVGSDHDAVFLTLVDEIRAESRPPAVKGTALRERYGGPDPPPARAAPLGAWTRTTVHCVAEDLAVPPDLVLREALRLAGLNRVPAVAR